MRELRCEGCGDRFRCRVDDPEACWCESVAVPAEGRAALGSVASDCVCPACLDEAAATGVGVSVATTSTRDDG